MSDCKLYISKLQNLWKIYENKANEISEKFK